MADAETLLGFAPIDFFFAEEVDCFLVPGVSQLQNMEPIAKFEPSEKTMILSHFAERSSFAIGSKKYLLPKIHELYGQESFADVSMGWQPTGLLFHIAVETGSLTVSYPEIRQGDSIELFIDTRAVVHARTTHRFCHHFFFLPERFEGRQAGEITRFRTEDTHPHCQPELLDIQTHKTATGYSATIFIPSECLVGYDPQEGGRLCFTYRINRFEGACQSFAFSAELARLEQLPYLWTTLRLVGSDK